MSWKNITEIDTAPTYQKIKRSFMSKVKISELKDAPSEGSGKQINLTHPLTETKYVLAMFCVEEKYYVMTDECRMCGGSLGRLPDLRGMFACLLYTSPSPRDLSTSRMPSSA